MLFDQALKDTPDAVEKIQIDLLKQAGQARRTKLMLSLSQSMFELSWHNLRQKNPNLSERELNLKFAELLYGPKLANALKAYLQKRDVGQ